MHRRAQTKADVPQLIYNEAMEKLRGCGDALSLKARIGPKIAKDIRSVTPGMVLAILPCLSFLLANGLRQAASL